MFWWFMIYVVVNSLLFYAIFPKTTGQRKRRAAANGAIFALAPAIVLTFASAAHPARSFGLLLIASANVAYSCVIWRDIAAGEGRNLRAWSAVWGTGLVLALYYPVIYSLDCLIRGIGGKLLAVLEGWIVMVALVVLLTFVWSTFCRQRRYSRGAVAVRWIAIALVAIMTISSVVSAAVAVPQSKSVKAAGIPSVFATDGEAFEGLKEFFGRIFGNSKEVALAAPDDESVAAEVADESVVAEVEDEAEADAKAETDDEAEVVEVKWGTYEKVIKDHPEFTIYNFPLTTDDDPNNNSYFGPNIYDPNKTATEYWKTIKEMMEKDPFILAESIATADEARHTDLCGAYYNGDDAEWAEAINRMVEDFFDKPGTFVNLSERFINMLNNETRELQLVHLDNVQDQYFLDIYTRKGIPRLVVCETHQSGDVLIAWTRTKGGPENDVGLGFRLQCGNVCAIFLRDGTVIPVSEEMKIPVEKVPEMPKGYDPPEPTKAPTPTPKPEPTVTPTPVPGEGSDPAKDPSKAPKENTEKNDDPGTGLSTNSGQGSTKSSEASESQKASDNGSIEDYDRAVEQNRAANGGGGSDSGSSGSGSSSGQRAGGESNQPSQSVSGEQDNNGNTGNGGSSIDKPTAKTETAVSADTNQSVDESGSADGIIEISD